MGGHLPFFDHLKASHGEGCMCDDCMESLDDLLDRLGSLPQGTPLTRDGREDLMEDLGPALPSRPPRPGLDRSVVRNT
jgi:hypothetical protein